MKGKQMNNHAIKAMLVALSVGLAMSCACADDYYNEQGRAIRWMAPNIPFGIVRGVLTIAQGPLEFFTASAEFIRKQQGKASSDDEALGNAIAVLGIVGPFGAVVGCLTHTTYGAADILTLGMCSDKIYSSGLVTPLIWDEEGFLKTSKITKGGSGSYTRTESKVQERPVVHTPSQNTSPVKSVTIPVSTSVPGTDDDD